MANPCDLRLMSPLFVVTLLTAGNNADGSATADVKFTGTVPTNKAVAPSLKLNAPPADVKFTATIGTAFVASSTTLPTLSVTDRALAVIGPVACCETAPLSTRRTVPPGRRTFPLQTTIGWFTANPADARLTSPPNTSVVAPITAGNSDDGSEPAFDAVAEATVPTVSKVVGSLKLNALPPPVKFTATVPTVLASSSTTLPVVSVTDSAPAAIVPGAVCEIAPVSSGEIAPVSTKRTFPVPTAIAWRIANPGRGQIRSPLFVVAPITAGNSDDGSAGDG